MALIFPPNRRMHVTRIFGTNEAGDVLSDTWLDVARLDEITIKTQDALHTKLGNDTTPLANQYQEVTIKLKWRDEDGEEPEDGENRVTEILKVCSPDEDDFENPRVWIPLRVIKHVKLNDSQTINTRRFIQSVSAKNRKEVEHRRYYHYDTNIDEDAEAAAESGQKIYRVESDQYQKIDESKNEDDYLEVEVPMKFGSQATSHWLESLGGADTKTTFKIKNEFLIEDTDPALFEEVGQDNRNPPWRTDPFQAIINHQFGGLAVEFDDGEYIEIPSGPADTKKGVISLWFRVPSSSVAAKSGDEGDDDEYINLFQNVIPIMTFGPTARSQRFEFGSASVGGYAYQDYMYNANTETTGGEKFTPDGPSSFVEGFSLTYTLTDFFDIAPSFIGVDCTDGDPILIICVRMPASSSATMTGGLNYAIQSSVSNSGMGGLYLGSISSCEFIAEEGPLEATYTVTFTSSGSDAQKVLGATPETFIIGGRREFDNQGEPIHVTPDRWHHVLFSFDFTSKISTTGIDASRSGTADCIMPSGICGGGTDGSDITSGTVGSYCKAYLAFDDENITGTKLTRYRGFDVAGAGTYVGGPNDILTVNGFKMHVDTGYVISDTSCIRFGRQETRVGIVPEPTFEYTPVAVPVSQGSFGFPASSTYASHITTVELAEFQFFSDVSINTGTTANRRAFITKEGKPAPMSAAEELFGKEPELKLHKSSNWQVGKNTGTHEPTEPEMGIYVGEIEKYKPDPSLFGEQG